MYRCFESLLVEQCAPTLAGIKPASLFRCGADSDQHTRQTAEHWDHVLTPFGIRVYVLKECPCTGDCMIYVYRPDLVAELLSNESLIGFLKICGYRTGPVPHMLDQLSFRFCQGGEYPHEIGLFLGYPLSDVKGFIENKGWNYTCCGYWKVYGDPEKAQAYFDLCRQCTSRYCALYASGRTLLELAAG